MYLKRAYQEHFVYGVKINNGLRKYLYRYKITEHIKRTVRKITYIRSFVMKQSSG